MKLFKNKRRNTPQEQLSSKRKEPSGFTNPIVITHELADFLNVPKDVPIPRSEVTKKIFQYVKENDLKNHADGRKFDLTDITNPKAQSLKALLRVENDEEIGYFTLQKYLKIHILKNHVPLEEEEEDVTALGTMTTSEETANVEENNPPKKKKHTLQFSTNLKKKKNV